MGLRRRGASARRRGLVKGRRHRDRTTPGSTIERGRPAGRRPTGARGARTSRAPRSASSSARPSRTPAARIAEQADVLGRSTRRCAGGASRDLASRRRLPGAMLDGLELAALDEEVEEVADASPGGSARRAATSVLQFRRFGDDSSASARALDRGVADLDDLLVRQVRESGRCAATPPPSRCRPNPPAR